MTTQALRIRTPGKVNPVLEVLFRRPDGYHELSLIFQAVGLYDELVFTPLKEGVTLSVEGAALAADDSNLVVKAAKLFVQEVLAGKGGAAIILRKGIPLEAGMGGGSSDAAAVLRAMDLLFQTKAGETRLSDLAARLGSDVPFFLSGGAAWGKGRGERITPLAPGPGMHLVLVKPSSGLSTPAVYRSGKALMTDGKKAGDFPGILLSGGPAGVAAALFNGLEPAALSLLPEVGEIKKRLLDAGALGALVSGSGPTVFAIAASQKEAGRIADKMREPDLSVSTVKTLSTGIEIL